MERYINNQFKFLRAILTLSMSAFLFSCESRKVSDVQFSYRGIIDKEYRFNVGRVIPVTISQSVETDGDISPDGNFFFYSSDADGGNFDIYLRSMGDITTVRLTNHPSRDTNPVISPDGKKLAFVSFRDDPEGDIFILKLKPEDLLTRASEGSDVPPMDTKAVNLTLDKDPATGVVINVKDANPCWSPDGKSIVCSSSKNGKEDIWLMKSDGSSKKQITSAGGIHPSFSPDGKKIIYISYSENRFGDVYSVETDSGKTVKLTSGNAIKLYPSFAGGDDRIIFSSIEEDTNRNGSLDLQDRSVIRFLDLRSGLSYPMTKSSETSFKAKWLPVLNTRDYSGVIIYTDLSGENVNLNIIPESGIIPKKLSARLQYELCETYFSEYDDPERYAMALESVFNFYGEAADNSSRAYVNRALKEAALYYFSRGDSEKSRRSVSLLKERSTKNDLYAAFALSLIENRKSDADTIIKKMAEDSSRNYFAPFALEDSGDLAFISGDRARALTIYGMIQRDYPKFERDSDIQTKTALSSDNLLKGVISEEGVNVINKGNTNQKITVITNLLNPLHDEKFSQQGMTEYLKNINALKPRFSSDKKVSAVLYYASGLINDNLKKTDEALKDLAESIAQSHPNDLTYYFANIRLADMERRLGRNSEAEKYYSAGINRYSRRFKTENFREKLLWTVNYYEQAGERSSSAGDFSSAVQTYDKYINLLTLMHNKRLYPDIYAEFAPRAHVLYIDAYTNMKGSQGIDELIKSYSDRLPVLRMDFNRAALYGLAYIYTKKAMNIDSESDSILNRSSKGEVFEYLYKADRQIEWALFIDDTFIEPYLLKSWINQFVDLQRKEQGSGIESAISGYFPQRLWEKNITLLDRALNANDETLRSENEGNIHLNMGNSYFLLLNYPRALNHYRMALKYKKSFGSDIEKALFHFHLGYTLWQNGEVTKAGEEISKAYGIYSSLAAGTPGKYREQMLTLYRYFALFSRYEGRFAESIEWYNRILKHAEETGLSIDRARYLQEIAFCHKELGDYETSRSYIEQADTLLREYPDDRGKYYLRIRLFGLGPFPVWNMGPDTAVIGENRIFTPLDTESKKLLSISMLEEIAVKNSRYDTAIQHLKKKISILEKNSTSVAVETRIRSLNNLGYYHFRSGSTADAEKMFRTAGELSAENNNLQGIFSSMMNMANLYALMIEEGKNDGHNWLPDIEKFLARIEKYRGSYFDLRFSQEKASLEAEAKAKKTKVTPEQIETLKQEIEKQTSDIYYELDTSIAIMKFYRAEILYGSSVKSSGEKGAFDLYTHNREIFNLYSDSLKMFENGIAIADRQGRKELKVKLLINAAACYSKTGETEKAYVALIDAKNQSDQFILGWTGIAASFALGEFLTLYGKDIESGDYRGLAERHISSAIARIEEHPLLYASRPGKIKRFYDTYSAFLIGSGRGERGFSLQERLTRVERIISINSLNTRFSDEYDRESYSRYVTEIEKLASIRERRSALLIAGSAAASPEVLSLNKEEKAQKDKLAALYRELESKNSRIAPYIELKEQAYRGPHDILSFMKTDRGLYHWKLSSGKLTQGYLKSDSAEDISAAITASSKNGVFILTNGTSLDLMQRHRGTITGNYSLINALDRAEIFSKWKPATGVILSKIKGIKSPSEGAAVEYTAGGTDLTPYRVIIDSPGSESRITPEVLFSDGEISPWYIITDDSALKSGELPVMMEGALYAGTGGLILTFSSNASEISEILKNLYAGAGYSSASPRFIMAGYINSFSSVNDEEKKRLASAAVSNLGKALGQSNLTTASVSLSEWKTLSPDERKKQQEYLWLISLLRGDYAGAMKVLETSATLSTEEEYAVRFRRIYTLLHKGDFAEALTQKKALSGAEKYSDYEFIEVIFDAVNGRDSAAERLLKIKRPYSTLIPAERYLILAAQYIYLYNAGKGREVCSLAEMKHLSLNERMMEFIITGRRPPAGISPRIDRIASLTSDRRVMEQESLKLVRSEGSFDRISVFPPLTVMVNGWGSNNQYISSLDIENITAAADTPAALLLLQRSLDSLSDKGSADERLRILRLMKKRSMDSSVFHVIRESMYRIAVEQMTSGDYKGAYREGTAADERFSPADRLYPEIQLLLADLLIKGGDFKRAEQKTSLVRAIADPAPRVKYLLDLQLSMIELNRLSSLKSATANDAAAFERLFSSALGYLKLNPAVLNIHGYREMTSAVFDEYINYKMKTGQHSDAHYYNEMKKILISSSVTGVNLAKTAGTADITAIQQALPDRCGYINIARVKNDIFIWLVDNKMKKALWIENGYKTIELYLKDHKVSALKDSDVKKMSSELQAIFEPLAAYFQSRKKLIISPDSFTETIPFEIIGREKMLSETAEIYYIASPLLMKQGRVSAAGGVKFIGRGSAGFQSHVERVAVRESGIAGSDSAAITSGIAHITGRLTHEASGKGFLLDGADFLNAAGTPDFIYASPDESRGSTPLDFALYASAAGIKSAVINSSPVSDLNRGVFAGEFYSSVNSGNSIPKSFRTALEKTRWHSRYRNPAAWSGFRLYIYNLNFLKDME